MARLVTTQRPPILASLCLFGAVVSLAPRTHVETPTQTSRHTIEFSGDPRFVITMPLLNDQAMVIKPPAIDPLIFIHDVGFDDVLSGFLGLLAPPEPPHC